MKTPTKLTVIIRDDFPMTQCGDSPAYRTISIPLTEDQQKALSLVCNERLGTLEVISRAILE